MRVGVGAPRMRTSGRGEETAGGGPASGREAGMVHRDAQAQDRIQVRGGRKKGNRET